MTAAAVVDLSFTLIGRSVAEDYADALWQALRGSLPWLENEPAVAVHPLLGTSPGQDGGLYLSRRTRLILRLPTQRVADAQRLSGSRLTVGGDEVAVGGAVVKPLWPATVLYSSFVHVGAAEEAAFIAECLRQLAALGVETRLMAGKARGMAVEGRRLEGFSLMLHGLEEDASLRVQAQGLGAERLRGCGVFVPHKSVAAVGA